MIIDKTILDVLINKAKTIHHSHRMSMPLNLTLSFLFTAILAYLMMSSFCGGEQRRCSLIIKAPKRVIGFYLLGVLPLLCTFQ